LNDNPTLSNDRLTRIKFGRLYAKPKVRLSRAKDHDYSLKLRCDYAISFVSQAIAEK